MQFSFSEKGESMIFLGKLDIFLYVLRNGI